MAKLRIKKIEIAASVSDSEKIVKLLQRRGVVELSEPEKLDNLYVDDKTECITEIEKKLQTAEAASNILAKYKKKKGGLLASLNERPTMTDEEYDKKLGDIEETYNAALKVIELDKKLADNKAAVIRLNTQADALVPWKPLELPLDYKGTKKVAVLIGTMPGSTDRERILTLLASELPGNDCVDCDIVSQSAEQTSVAVYCLKKDRESVEQTLRANGFVRFTEPISETAKSRIEKLRAEADATEKDSEKAVTELTGLTEYLDKLEFFKDWCSIEKDKLAAIGKISHTKHIFVLSGYVPEIRSEKLKTDIENKFDAAVIISEPDEEDDVPVMLKNNGFAAPVEGITEMYALPGKNDFDPTGIMAFFYYVFFGMMLSDAGYGLIIALATGFALLKFKMENKTRNTCKMYFFCGVSTVFWGAMYGSWFGDMPNIIGSNFFNTDKFASTAIWIDPLKQLMELLVYCFIFGLVHLFTGVGIKAYTLWKQGHKLDALCESIPTAVAIFGLCPIFFGLFTEIPAWLSKIGTPVLITGVLLVIATAGRSSKSIGGKIGGGLYGLYNLVSGYLGDVLSYARLLALGLSTGVIAQVVNMLCTLPGNNALKAVMLVVVGTVGHIANLGINLIGAYVHTNRLQYVEFFSKFYEGGGRAMRPLKINTKAFKFKEEN